MKLKLKLFVYLILISVSSFSVAVDTDHDGLPDDWEIENGRNPNLADYQVSAGKFHTCAIDDDGVKCWSKLDPSTQFSIISDVGQIDVPPLENPFLLSAGSIRSCAVDDTGVVCWGRNTDSGNNAPSLLNPRELAVATDWASVCAIDDSGLVCWGDGNTYGQITPPDITNPRGLTAGNVHFCAIGDEGAQCWGGGFDNDYTDMSSLTNPSYISAGEGSTCAIDDSGVVCFGYINNWDIPTLSNPLIVEVGGSSACAIDDTGVHCWGTDAYSGSKLLEVPTLLNPHNLTINKTATLGYHHACSVTDEGVICWGHNQVGQVNVPVLSLDPDGDGYNNQGGLDTFPLDSSEWIDTDSDGIGNNSDVDDDADNVIDSTDPWPLDRQYSSDTDGDGLPDSYELTNGNDLNDSSDAANDIDGDGLTILQEFGYGTSDNRSDSDFDSLPDTWEIQNLRNPAVPDYIITTGTSHACALDDNGILCWGKGQNYWWNIPPAMDNIISLSAGTDHSCALNNITVKCWGNPYSNGSVDVPSLKSPTKLSSGNYGSCALERDGVVCWGDLESSAIPDLVNPVDLSVGQDICAIDESGVVCWGANGLRENVPELQNPRMVASNTHRAEACVIDDKGLICWQALNNDNGDSITSRLVQVGGVMVSAYTTRLPASDIVGVSVGEVKACLTRSDKTITCWGQGTVNNPLPITIDGVSAVSARGYEVCFLSSQGVNCLDPLFDLGVPSLPNVSIDPDGDGYNSQDGVDMFPLDSLEWLDTDLDGIGNNSDTDDDGDSVPDIADAFPLDSNESLDADGDGVGDNADIFPNDASETVDSDIDGVGDNSDNCVNLANTDQMNSDDDLLGNSCDDDDDNDGLNDQYDAFPLDASEQMDSDGDGVGDNADVFPSDASETLDTDIDGIGNNADTDDDDDGVNDDDDDFPLNHLYSIDTDIDGMPDVWEIKYGLNPNDPSDATSDQDNDGVTALDEFLAGTIPAGSLDIDGNGQYDALTDGLLLLRGMFLLSGDSLISDAVASDAVYKTSDEIASRIDMLGDLVDIDGNGTVDALTDGLVILRYLFNLRGDVLINDVIASDATVKTAEDVEAKIEQLIPSL